MYFFIYWFFKLSSVLITKCYYVAEIGTVIAPYDATSSEQLSLQLGQLIQIRKKTDTGWWEGELQVCIGKLWDIGARVYVVEYLSDASQCYLALSIYK